VVTEAEKKVLLDAVHELVRELFDTAHAHGAAESEKSAKISAIDEEYKPKLAAYARRESDIKRQLGELLGPNYDGLTEPARTALITLADGYYVKRTRPESLELIGELDRIIESIELALVSHSSDHTIDEFVTYPDPVILKDVIMKKENRYLI
jgi:phage host-nuclease inhibitor protein Gam